MIKLYERMCSHILGTHCIYLMWLFRFVFMKYLFLLLFFDLDISFLDVYCG